MADVVTAAILVMNLHAAIASSRLARSSEVQPAKVPGCEAPASCLPVRTTSRLPAPVAPHVSVFPVQIQEGQRVLLTTELNERLAQLASMHDGWDGAGSRRPLAAALATAEALGREILKQPTDELPNALNISAARDGSICFTVFGKKGREVELWAEGVPCRLAYLAVDGDEEVEGEVSTTEYAKLSAWLHHGAELPA